LEKIEVGQKMNMIDLAVFSEKIRNLLLLIVKEPRRIEQAVQGLLISNYGKKNRLVEPKVQNYLFTAGT
jgi:hypothetical protein